MNHIDPPGINLSMAIQALMNSSSGTIEEISREVLVAVACFLENQGKQSECGGINSVEGFGKAASQEYDELVKFRKHFDDLDAKRAKK